jgi:drug/metabolite transporter (DMT)-like permease
MTLLLNGVFVAIVAHGIIGTSLVWDKVLLRRPATSSLPSYVFWLGALSVLGLLLIPFGFKLPSAKMIGLAFLAGVVHMTAIWFYYVALQLGEASQTLAVMGGFSPLATALIAMALLSKPLAGSSLSGFVLLVAGGFVMFFAESLNWLRVLPSVLLSASLFGFTNVLQKLVFNATGFVTGYVVFTAGTAAGAASMLLFQPWRRQIFQRSEEAPPRSRFWYFVNRFLSGVGSFLIFFAISRTNPAIVDSISGVRYVVIFVTTYLLTRVKPEWLQEDFRRFVLISKAIATVLIIAGLLLVGSGESKSGAVWPMQYTVMSDLNVILETRNRWRFQA